MQTLYAFFLKHLKSSIVLLLVTMVALPGVLNAQTSTVKGKVTDDKGQPIPAATVKVKGTSTVQPTSADGDFAIPASKGDVLVITAVSFVAKEVAVTDARQINITLATDIAVLSDVVVVGYGKQNRKNLVSSVSTVAGSDLNKGAISDVGQMLQGKVPGLNISRSGDPNRAAAIILRGASTLREGAQSPLFVIDGVPGADISILAPDDIASIDVLKDASAAAIYGNRAANGVIMVTTKKGKSGQSQITYSGYGGIEKVSNQYKMMDADQLKAFLAANGQAITPQNDKGANTNWQDEVQRSTAYAQNHNLSLSGGTNKTTYSASINYFKQQGIVKRSGLERFIGRIAVDQKAINDKLKLGFSLSNSISDADQVPYRNTVLQQMLTYLPTSPVRNPDGTYFDNFIQNNYYNPVSLIENAKENQKLKNLLATFTVNVKLPWGFTYDVVASYQNRQSNFGAYYNSYYTANYNNIRNTPDPPANPTIVSLVGANGLAVRNSYQYTNKILETYLTWDRQFGDHSVNAVVGYSYQQFLNGDGFQSSSTNFPSDDVSYNNLALGNSYGVTPFRVNYGPDLYENVQLISDFARLNYNYKNKYLFQGSVRRDGSNVFGSNHRWGFFPSVGGAWRIMQESFMKDQKIFNDLKLRASYGVAGNSAGFDVYTTRLIYGLAGQTYSNGTYISAIGPRQNDNPDLRWEKTATVNVGLDFSIFNGKVNGSVDVYDKRTSDLIYTYDVSQSVYVFPTLTANVGKLSNKGIELSINTTPVKTNNFSWNTNFNLAHNTNKVISLSNEQFKRDSITIVQPDGGGQTGSTVQFIAAGQPIGTFFTFNYAGKNAAGVSQYYNKAGNLTTTPLNRTDYYTAGNAQPKLLLGWSNSFQYKNIDLNVFFRSVLGNKIMNVTRADLFRPGTAQFNNIPVEVANESTSDFNSYRYSSRFIESGSYVRLDNATLGYTFGKSIPGVKSLRVYLTANNLFVITGYKGIDPEINQGGVAPGVDTNNFYPKTRTVLVGLNVSFN